MLSRDFKPLLVFHFQNFVTKSLLINNHDDLELYRETLFTVFRELDCVHVGKILETDFIEVIQAAIETMIRSQYSFEDSKMADFMGFLNVKIDPIITAIFSNDLESCKLWKQRLEFQIYRTVGLLLLEKSFDIIRDYPDSMDALKDLKVFVKLM